MFVISKTDHSDAYDTRIEICSQNRYNRRKNCEVFGWQKERLQRSVFFYF